MNILIVFSYEAPALGLDALGEVFFAVAEDDLDFLIALLFEALVGALLALDAFAVFAIGTILVAVVIINDKCAGDSQN